MPTFKYKALKTTGGVAEGVVEATGRPDALRQIQILGLRPVNLVEKAATAAKKNGTLPAAPTNFSSFLRASVRLDRPFRRGSRKSGRTPSLASLCHGGHGHVSPGSRQFTVSQAGRGPGPPGCPVECQLPGRVECQLRVVGWSIDSSQTAALVTNALGMAIANRDPQPGVIVHSDHGGQFTSWAFTERAKRSGLVPSMGSIGDCYDNAMSESFWGRMQTELLNRKRWKTRIELADAIFDYLEVFHNRQRRHSSLGMRTPIEFELQHQSAQPVA